jgi:hypothetical protein
VKQATQTFMYEVDGDESEVSLVLPKLHVTLDEAVLSSTFIILELDFVHPNY